jgi:hypothetical protein
MRARIRLFKYFLFMGYSIPAAWDEADRQSKFHRRCKH